MITVGNLNELATSMKAAPKVENINRKIRDSDALEKLVPAMLSMQKNGYEPAQIADAICAGGVRTTARAVARLLRPKSQ